MLASSHLIISSAPFPHCTWLTSILLAILVETELLRVSVLRDSPTAVSVILWFWDPVTLRFWVCQSSWESSCLWDPEILMWSSSCDPVILWSCDFVFLGVLEHPGVEFCLGVVRLSLRVRDQGKLVQTWRNPSYWSGGVPVSLHPTGPSYSQWCRSRCCFLLTLILWSLTPGSGASSGCCWLLCTF